MGGESKIVLATQESTVHCLGLLICSKIVIKKNDILDFMHTVLYQLCAYIAHQFMYMVLVCFAR